MSSEIKKHIKALEDCYVYLYDKEGSVDNVKNIEELDRHARKLITITGKIIRQKNTDNTTIVPQRKLDDVKSVFNSKFVDCCYMCKRRMDKAHKHYKHMCTLCGHINWSKRFVRCDMNGINAVVTGGRIKIGFETAIRLLKNGANVIVSTRFSADALERYKAEKDYDEWKDRLSIVQVNFLSIKSVQKFVDFIKETFTHLDVLINNAAQTIRRAAEFYNNEINKTIEDTDNNIKLIVDKDIKILSLKEIKMIENNNEDNCTDINVNEYFPPGKLDEFGQQIDLNPINSWVLEMGNIDIQECTEVHLINSIIPFALISALMPMMKKVGSDFSWIINVSSMEGCFNRQKSTSHPHTNMAKASLNMMTRTASGTLIKDHIVLCSVDTGWNNNQMPNSYGTVTPVDCADGAARILDPIYRKLKKPGVFYKDFKETDW